MYQRINQTVSWAKENRNTTHQNLWDTKALLRGQFTAEKKKKTQITQLYGYLLNGHRASLGGDDNELDGSCTALWMY